MTDAYRQALAAMDAGDVTALEAVLAAHPQVVRERAGEDEAGGTYQGYFAHATLLHHVAGNPIRGDLPENIVEVARVLIQAGADVNAPCGGGPAQPESGGGTVLGLVASGALMADSGLYRPMIDLLLESGVDLGNDQGILSVCLYHTVECQRQRQVGTYLASKGARVDLVFAAALGRTDLVAGFVGPGGALTADAHGPFRKDAAERRTRSDAALKQEALTWACMNGQDATVKQLLDLGAEVNGVARVTSGAITPLHAAAWAGWASTAQLLLDRGADWTRKDEEHRTSPIAWAAWCHRQDVVELFRDAQLKGILLEDLVGIGSLDQLQAALAGADVNAVPSGVDSTPGVLLRWAAVYGRADVVRWLLGRGADRSLASQDGRTALDHARQRGHQEVVSLLTEQI